MADFTRRTHIVRISDAKKGDPPSETYIDIEVLDAISFRDANGKEMILNMPAAKVVACINDDTGGGHSKQPNNPTRLSHMKRIIGDDPKQKLDVEVIDIASFRDANGKEWILDMHNTNGQPSVFNTSDSTNDSNATRRTHNEKISSDPLAKNSTEFVTVERCDAISFRSLNGQELVIKCPSDDDPNSTNKRASTVTTPSGYDPLKAGGPIPPPNSDSNIYITFVAGASGFLTGKTKIPQGPLWWIRKVSASGPIVFVKVDYTVSGEIPPVTPDVRLVNMPYDGVWNVFGDITQPVKPNAKPPPIVNPVTGAMLSSFYQWTPKPAFENSTMEAFKPTIIYYVNDGSVEITADNYNLTFPFGTDNCGQSIGYIGAAGGTFLNCNSNTLLDMIKLGINPLPERDNGGVFRTPESAAYYAASFNTWSSFVGYGLQLSVGALQVTIGSKIFTKIGTAVFELNVNQIKAALIASLGKGATPPTKLTFTISVEPNHGSVNIAAQGYKTLRDFKLADKNAPAFTPWEPQQFSVSFNTTTRKVIGSIDLATLDVTFEPGDDLPPVFG